MTNLLVLILLVTAAVFWRQAVALALCAAIILSVCGALYLCKELDDASTRSMGLIKIVANQ